jgi:hypothetical protein
MARYQAIVWIPLPPDVVRLHIRLLFFGVGHPLVDLLRNGFVTKLA